MISESIEERQWAEQLRAMRHLPPGTILPSPADLESSRLLTDLLALADDVAPLPWLAAERGHSTAFIALRRVLQRLGHRASGLMRSSNAGRGASEDILPALVPLAPLIQLADDPAPSINRLSETIRTLRASRNPLPSISPPNLDVDLELLEELLRLPEARNPIDWIAVERGDRAARIALQSVLSDVIPPAVRSLGHPIARRQLRHALRLGRGIRAVVQEIDAGHTGFAITVHLRFSGGRLQASGSGRQLPFWAGFDRVVDNQGNHYLLQRAEWQAGTYLWWYRERLRIIGYPAVAAGADTLIFSASPAILAYRLMGGGMYTSRQLPDEPLDDVTWSVDLPRSVLLRS